MRSALLTRGLRIRDPCVDQVVRRCALAMLRFAAPAPVLHFVGRLAVRGYGLARPRLCVGMHVHKGTQNRACASS